MHFRNDHVIKNVVIIGSGGTGSRLVPQIVQFLKTVPLFEQLDYPKVYLLDDDVVETKNLKRQLFIKPDIGKNKASVIADRYEKAYSYPIIDIDLKFQDLGQAHFEGNPGYDQLIRAIQKQMVAKGSRRRTRDLPDSTLDFILDHQYTVFILCVDSVESRIQIFNEINKTRRPDKYIIIDAGNENTFGQVSTFHLKSYSAESEADYQHEWYNRALMKAVPEAYNTVKDINTTLIPFPWHLYANREESEIACADLDQTLAMNSLMASGIMSVFQNIALMNPVQVVTTYYNLNGIHTHESLNFSSFKAAPYSIKESLRNSGLLYMPHVFENLLLDFNSDETDPSNQTNALFSVLDIMPTPSSTREDGVNFNLRHWLMLLEAKYYEHYIENGIGFTKNNLETAYFLDCLNDHDMINISGSQGRYCRFNVALDIEHLYTLSDQEKNHLETEIEHIRRTDSVIHVSFLIETVDYLNLFASYLIHTGQTTYGHDTYHLLTAGVVKGMAIPMLTPRICSPPVSDSPDLILRDLRYERLTSRYNEEIYLQELMSTRFITKLESFLGYLDKFIQKRYAGDYREFFTYGSVLLRDYYRPDVDPDCGTPRDISLIDDNTPAFKEGLFDSMKELFSRLRSEKSSEIFKTDLETETDTVF